MIELSRRQTRSLSRMFTKIDFDEIAFDSDEEHNVLIRAKDQAGWTARITINPEGRVIAALSEKDEGDLREAGILE